MNHSPRLFKAAASVVYSLTTLTSSTLHSTSPCSLMVLHCYPVLFPSSALSSSLSSYLNLHHYSSSSSSSSYSFSSSSSSSLFSSYFCCCCCSSSFSCPPLLLHSSSSFTSYCPILLLLTRLRLRAIYLTAFFKGAPGIRVLLHTYLLTISDGLTSHVG